MLDSTWAGNLTDMVRFEQEMQIVRDEKLVEAVPEKSEKLVAGLKKLQADFPGLVKNVRDMGLYQGFTLASPAHKSLFLDQALELEELLLLGAGTDSIKLRPVLDVTLADIDLLLTKLRRLLILQSL